MNDSKFRCCCGDALRAGMRAQGVRLTIRIAGFASESYREHDERADPVARTGLTGPQGARPGRVHRLLPKAGLRGVYVSVRRSGLGGHKATNARTLPAGRSESGAPKPVRCSGSSGGKSSVATALLVAKATGLPIPSMTSNERHVRHKQARARVRLHR